MTLIEQWQEHARTRMVEIALGNYLHAVSVNDLYREIKAGMFPAPPDVQAYKRGHALCRVFLHKMFTDSGNTVLSINPISKSRKVKVWIYCPEQDDRRACVSRRSPWDIGGRDWA